MPNRITLFRGEHAFLSNFHRCRVHAHGLYYTSAEAAFQAWKASDPLTRAVFQTLSPREAKAYGRTLDLPPKWEATRLHAMHTVLRSKFDPEVNRTQALNLLQTGNAELVELNTWGDTFWGQIQIGPERYQGSNWLGRLLTLVRSEVTQHFTR